MIRFKRKPRQINLRIEEALKRKLQIVAGQRAISINHLMNEILKTAMDSNQQVSLTKPHPSNHRED